MAARRHGPACALALSSLRGTASFGRNCTACATRSPPAGAARRLRCAGWWSAASAGLSRLTEPPPESSAPPSLPLPRPALIQHAQRRPEFRQPGDGWARCAQRETAFSLTSRPAIESHGLCLDENLARLDLHPVGRHRHIGRLVQRGAGADVETGLVQGAFQLALLAVTVR